MKKSKLFSFLFVLIIPLIFSIPALAQISDTVGVVDTLRVGSTMAYPGSEVCIPIYAFNDEPLGAMVIPLVYSSYDLIYDSTSFVGTRLAPVGYKGAEADSINRTIKIYAITFSSIDPGTDEVAYLYFRVNESATSQVVEIDTFSTADPSVYLDFTYTWAVDMIPAFVKGAVTIEEINFPPQIQPLSDQFKGEGDTLLMNIYASDPEGDSIILSVINSPPEASFIDSGNGSATFFWIPPYTGPWSSENSPYTITFLASDGDSSSSEDVLIYVVNKIPGLEDYALEVGADTGIYRDTVVVPIELSNPDSVRAMKLLIQYDHTALTLLQVSRINTRISNWEYFEAQDSVPDVGNITILAQADKASYVEGSPKQLVTSPMPPGSGVIANLIFIISLYPYTQEIDVATDIKFIFSDSTDNTLKNSKDEFIGHDKIQYSDGYVLIEKLTVLLGDINLNGIPYEIGDAIVFGQYLMDPVTNDFNEQQKLNSDVNEDGTCCSLSDYMLLLKRILEGEGVVTLNSVVQDKIVKVNLDIKTSTIDLFIDSEIPVGGAMFVIQHPGVVFGVPVMNPDVTQMSMLNKDNLEELRVLIYSEDAKYIDAGERKLFSIPIIEGDGNIELSSVSFSGKAGDLMGGQIHIEENKEIPHRFTLPQNYPNPFNSSTEISFYLTEESKVSLVIYNILGQVVNRLVEDKLASGKHTAVWDGRDSAGNDVASGIYFYRLEVGSFSETKKMIMLK